MKMNEIKKLARSKGVKGYFQSLYDHSIRVVESIPKEDIENIFKKSRKIETDTDGDIFGDVYALWISNGGYGKENTCISVDVMYGDPLYEQMEENITVHSSFDYRGLSMLIFFDERSDTVRFEGAAEEGDEKFEFLKSLTESEQLRVIFGKYLIENEGIFDGKHPNDVHVSFSVSIKFFED